MDQAIEWILRATKHDFIRKWFMTHTQEWDYLHEWAAKNIYPPSSFDYKISAKGQAPKMQLRKKNPYQYGNMTAGM